MNYANGEEYNGRWRDDKPDLRTNPPIVDEMIGFISHIVQKKIMVKESPFETDEVDFQLSGKKGSLLYWLKKIKDENSFYVDANANGLIKSSETISQCLDLPGNGDGGDPYTQEIKKKIEDFVVRLNEYIDEDLKPVQEGGSRKRKTRQRKSRKPAHRLRKKGNFSLPSLFRT